MKTSVVTISFLGALALSATLPRAALAACTITSNRYCINYDGTQFTISGGGTPVPRGTVTLIAGQNYTFEADTNVSATHPFILTTVQGGGTNSAAALIPGTTLTTPGQVIAFSPTTTTRNPIYYECSLHINMGGVLPVTGGMDAGAGVVDAGSDAGRTDAGSDAGVASDAGASSSSSSSSGSPSSSSSSSSGGSIGQAPQPTDGGCNVGGGASAWLGLSIAGLAQLVARRRRRAAT